MLSTKKLVQEGVISCTKRLAKLKSELVDEAIDSIKIQVVDVYEYIIRHIKKWEMLQSNNITEMYFLQVFHHILGILLRDTNLMPIIGEKTSKVTKAARELHGKFLGNHHKLNVYGRKIDLLLSVCDVELCANEWKATSSDNTLIRQQSKNIRVNKCLLDDLRKTLEENDMDNDCSLLCMDWNEFNGYMYIIKKTDGITVASLVQQLMIPIHLKEVPAFNKTLLCLLHFKEHYSKLADELEHAKLLESRKSAFNNIVAGLSVAAPDRSPSPTVYLSPKRD
ncbi:hypothetical protein G6F57_015325 [Rhizopus arrhizus]|uniref:Uncharacterized protein n=1 Tax=Rhizopus oryzae TaxID=64495 RepID=A0A9P6WX39_RHIOR|nr:hypothetical protein G6F24_013307 [Rhizopus arrhizus]KAG0775726.1 hypothetical protein G6F22_013088 [Rhizopus arrhizus]KAG0778860.1 hypothetical protein G6F21_012815 [Rhizopus arrhizus]KAG0816027.1 hypothetical protein G6F19_012939 [Rhizopus arrhizus]KAG0817108.1 hypothetical protein G6F18_012948 [Rhizopus arrhizus]